MEASRILLVEDSQTFSNFLSRKIKGNLGISLQVARSFNEAQAYLQQHGDTIELAILDLVLPDAPEGEIVDNVLQRGIPVIVLTSEWSVEMRERILGKRIVDYILKEELIEQNTYSLEYLVRLINRILHNKRIRVLVVDDSLTSRGHLRRLLETHRYDVLEAEDGEQALRILEEKDRIKLLFVDWNMPGMDGFELVHEVRKRYDMDEMAIIGISVYETGTLAAKFLKKGANDFLTKPFLNEEFYLRVMQNIQHIENVQAIKKISNQDYLTGLYNRKFFYEQGEILLAEALKKKVAVLGAMVDLDYFKKINDVYGHGAGDVFLKLVARELDRSCGAKALVARIGGEEFAVLAVGEQVSEVKEALENLRVYFSENDFEVLDQELRVTLSIGVALFPEASLEKMLQKADHFLYRAKANGRNCLMQEEIPQSAPPGY